MKNHRFVNPKFYLSVSGLALAAILVQGSLAHATCDPTTNGNDIVVCGTGVVPGVVDLLDGHDQLTINSGADLQGTSANGFSVEAGEGNDRITVEGGNVENGIRGDLGADTITVNDGTVGGLFGGFGNDTFNVNGGEVGNISDSGDVAQGGDDIANLFGGIVTGVNLAAGDDTINIDSTLGTSPLDLTAVGVFFGGSGNDNATVSNVLSGTHLADDAGWDSFVSVRFDNSIINMGEAGANGSSVSSTQLVNGSVLNQTDGTLRLNNQNDATTNTSTLVVDGTSRINMQDGATDDRIRVGTLRTAAGGIISVDVNTTAGGYDAAASDFIFNRPSGVSGASVHEPTAGALIDVNRIGSQSLSGSRRIVDDADVDNANYDPGLNAAINASTTYLLLSDPSTAAHTYWLQDEGQGGVNLMWTTNINSNTLAPLLGGVVTNGTGAGDPSLEISTDGPASALGGIGQIAPVLGAMGSISNFSGPTSSQYTVPSEPIMVDAKDYISGNQTITTCGSDYAESNGWISGSRYHNKAEGSLQDGWYTDFGLETNIANSSDENCREVFAGIFGFYGNSTSDLLLGSNNTNHNYGTGGYLRFSDAMGFYGNIMGGYSITQTEAFNSILGSTADYSSKGWFAAASIGKQTDIDQQTALDLRMYAAWSDSSSGKFKDSIGIVVNDLQTATWVAGAKARLDREIGQATTGFVGAGVKWTDVSTTLSALGSTIDAGTSLFTATGEIGFRTEFASNASFEVSGFGEIGDEFQSLGAKAAITINF